MRKTDNQLNREITDALNSAKEDGPVTASIRLSGAPTPMQTREFKHRGEAQAWLDQQREIADRRGWGGYRFELTPQASRRPRR